jgi:hypothetical protein
VTALKFDEIRVKVKTRRERFDTRTGMRKIVSPALIPAYQGRDMKQATEYTDRLRKSILVALMLVMICAMRLTI